MIRVKICVGVLVLVAGKLLCQTDQPNQGLPLVTRIKKTVVTIEANCTVTKPDGTVATSAYVGTAFFLSYPLPMFADKSLNYLVTNRHVAQPGVEKQAPCKISKYRIRLNRKHTANNIFHTDYLELGSDTQWSLSDDPSVDLAISPALLGLQDFDFLSIPVDMLLSDKEVEASRIIEGDEVLFAGLFIQLAEQSHFDPIVRQGKIAMMPSENTPTTLGTLGATYLVDSHVFGGNSGSPMFVALSGMRFGAITFGESYKLLGVVSGYVQETSDLKLQPVAGYAGTVIANSGIAVVVPAQKILDILNGNKMSADRNSVVNILKTAPK